MKRTFSSVLAGLVLAQSATVYAQNNAAPVPMPVIAGGGSGSTKVNTYADHGDYNLNNFSQDMTASTRDLLDNQKINQKIDRDYLQGLVDNMTAKLNELSNLKKQFNELMDLSHIGVQQVSTGKVDQAGKAIMREAVGTERFIKISKYAELVREINNKDQILQNEMETMSNMTRESLPSYDTGTAAGKDVKASAAGNVNTKPLIEKVEAKRKQIIGDMEAMTFDNLMAARNKVISIPRKDIPQKQGANALHPDLSGLSILEDADRKALQVQIKGLRILESDTQDLMKDMADKIVNMTNVYLTKYGTENWLRDRDDSDIKAAADAYQNIVNAFRLRSYVRRTLGPIGAIKTAIDYQKNIANWDKYGWSYQPLKVAVQSLDRTPAIKEEDVMSAFESARLFMQLYDEKTTGVFESLEKIKQKEIKKEDYASPNTGFLARANSAVTFVTGQRAAAETLLAIMRLVLEDTREEMVLYRSGRDELTALSDAHFRTTPEMKTEFTKVFCLEDWTLPDGAFNSPNALCPSVGVKKKAEQKVSQGGAAPGFSVIFSDLLAQYKNVEKAKWAKAQTIQKQLDADLMAGVSNDELKKQDQDATDDLLEKFR